MATARTYAPGRFALELDGVTCGFVDSLSGGDISADIAVLAVGNSMFFEKHIGTVRYEDFVAEIGLAMAQPVYDWIEAMLTANDARKDGSITSADQNLNAKSEQQFSRALLTEIGFPALDASAKDPVRLRLAFAPEFTRTATASGKVSAPTAAKAKTGTRGNFRFELDGLDGTHVRSIDAFTVKVEVTSDSVGDLRDVARQPGRIEVPNLSVTIADGPTAVSWQNWFEDFVIKGNCDPAHEKSGAIVYLAQDMKTELARVVLHGVGIFALRRSPRTAGGEAAPTLTAGLYCQRMELTIGGKPAPAKPAVVQPMRNVPLPEKPLGIRR